MECPKGVTHKKGKVVVLKKALYGLVQAAHQFYKHWKNVLCPIGFVQSNIYPCIFWKPGGTYIETYVDNNLVISKEEKREELLKLIKENRLNVTVEEDLEDYLNCQI